MTTRSVRSLLGLPLAAAVALTMTACGAEVEKAGDQPDRATASGNTDTNTDTKIETVKDGVLTVCTDPPYAPFEDTLGTEVIGFDIDLTTEIANDLGLDIEFVMPGFEAIESAQAFDSGSCDVGASALTITEDRLAKLDFSDPYYKTTMGLLVKADSGIKTLADLTGKPVGVQQGTTGEDWANEQPELTEIRQFETLGDQVTALKAGDVEGVFNDEPTLTPYVDEGFQVVSEFDTGEEFGFAVEKGNTALLDQINKTLDRLESDGTYDELLAKWFAGQ